MEILDARDTDPGDDVQRRFRYQHAYGVGLLARASSGDDPMTTLVCEHFEDLLGLSQDGKIDAYQVKTRATRLGEWTLSDSGFYNSIKRFVCIAVDFPGQIRHFKFVSNQPVAKMCIDEKKQKRSPIWLWDCMQKVDDIEKLDILAAEALAAFAKRCDSPASMIHKIAHQVHFVRGPSLEDFESVVAHQFLGKLSKCKTFGPVRLNQLRDHMMAMVASASAKSVDDGRKYFGTAERWRATIEAKSITVSDFEANLRPEWRAFEYAPGFPISLGQERDGFYRLEAKLRRAGIDNYFEIMRRRALSAEQHLLGLAQHGMVADEGTAMLNQIESVVLGACQDAHLEHFEPGQTFGRAMLKDVSATLRGVASVSPATVHHQSSDCLLGYAGLLTDECLVWWSDVFVVDGP